MIRQIIFYENHFLKFYQQQDQKVKGKIQYVFELIKQVDRVPKKFLDHITGTDGLFEIRINRIFIEFSVALTKGILWFFLTDFKKRPKKHRRTKLTKRFN